MRRSTPSQPFFSQVSRMESYIAFNVPCPYWKNCISVTEMLEMMRSKLTHPSTAMRRSLSLKMLVDMLDTRAVYGCEVY
jgi:hypothetical protein